MDQRHLHQINLIKLNVNLNYKYFNLLYLYMHYIQMMLFLCTKYYMIVHLLIMDNPK